MDRRISTTLVPMLIALWFVLSVTPTALLAARPASTTPPDEPAEPAGDYDIWLPIVLNRYVRQIYPNDPAYSDQWAMEKINAPYAWGISQGNGVLVAVLDSGVDLDHPDLSGKIRTDIDYDYINNDAIAQDDQGHGTHVAGIIGAATDNGRGVSGLGWQAMIVPYKVLDDTGTGSLSGIVNAIDAAVNAGARVINMSLGTPPGSGTCSQYPSLQNAITNAYNHGVLVVVAAGNDYGDDAATVVPANCPHVLTVSATDSNDALADYSNVGSVIDISAPGSLIYSTKLNDTYGYMSGTSMATPYVAGLAALIFAQHPDYTPDQVASAILDHAVDLGNAGWDTSYGCGRIDAGAAVLNGAAGSQPLCHSTALADTATTGRFVTENFSTQSIALPHGPYRPGVLIVKWESGIPILRSLVQVFGLEPLQRIADGSWLMRLRSGTEALIAQQLLRSGLVEYVTYDYLFSAQ